MRLVGYFKRYQLLICRDRLMKFTKSFSQNIQYYLGQCFEGFLLCNPLVRQRETKSSTGLLH
jgi:hypothetical protein